MKIGKVHLSMEYIVDLDNPEMVDEAKQCLYEDLMALYKYDELFGHIETAPAPEATEDDIPAFLLDQGLEEETEEV
jgi:hypothetical protein